MSNALPEEQLVAPEQINIARLLDLLEELGTIGLSEKDGGVYREAFSQGDMAGRSWLKDKAETNGFAFREDAAGNMFIRLEGNDSSLPPLLIGSHIDSVPCAGKLDGTLGVLAGLECLLTLKGSGVTPRRSIEVVSFSDEEGRFGGLFGSSAFAGLISQEEMDECVDGSGVYLSDAMREAGFKPELALSAKCRSGAYHSYLELHIEQGLKLRNENRDIGLVKGVAGLFRWVVTFTGVADHAGTTPMDQRFDAFQGLAEFGVKIDSVIKEFGTENTVATIGKVELAPGVMNIVPRTAEFAFEVRDTDNTVLPVLRMRFEQLMNSIAERRGLKVSKSVAAEVAAAGFDKGLLNLVEETSHNLGLGTKKMFTGAIHDAQKVSMIAPSALIFIPSEGGISHSPEEHSSPEEIRKGANLLLNLTCRLSS